MATSSDATSSARVVDALSAARALEADGQYNAAKLFRAAALGHALRATRDHPRPGPERARALADVIAAWRAERGEDALAAALAQALQAVEEGRPWVTLEEAPRTFVCRTCGEVMLGELPDACPKCGARQLTFQEVLPIYFLEPLDVEPLLATLASAPAEVARLCDNLSDEQATSGEWPPREIVLHLIAAEELFGGRVWRMLAEDEPFLASVPPPSADADAQTVAFTDLVARFRDARERTVARLRSLHAAQWERAGVHLEWGGITVRQMLGYMARHEQSHLGELEASCRAARDDRAGA